MALTDDAAMTDDVEAFDWTNDLALTAYVALTDDVSRSYWTKMIMLS